MTPSTTRGPALLVLDSNVVLDWLVFRDPSTGPLHAALGAGRARWIATEPMRLELEHVLTRGDLDRWQPDTSHIWAAWERWATLLPSPSLGAPHPLRCTDPDDQKFIDLACHAGASALLSRDRAVLKLAGRARALGLSIVSPQRWVIDLA